jgi:hypothetical protein
VNAVTLRAGTTRAQVLPDEGGVASELTVDGFAVLAKTAWAAQVTPSPAPAEDEETWVGRWRGGWQLCFPTAGAPDRAAYPTQGFHGAASQARWSVDRVDHGAVELSWADEAGLSASRRWTLEEGRLSAVTTAVNGGGASRRVIVAEHLILGQDVLDHLDEAQDARKITASGTVAELDYAGTPTGRTAPWPGPGWDRANKRTPPRVAALRHPSPRVIVVTGPRFRATVSWTGLEHALLWEEIGASAHSPWNGAVYALGVEPTSTPHGAGTAHPVGAVELEPGQTMTWAVSLHVELDEGFTREGLAEGRHR